MASIDWKKLFGLADDERDTIRRQLLEGDLLVERNGDHVVILVGDQAPITDDFIPSHLSKSMAEAARSEAAAESAA